MWNFLVKIEFHAPSVFVFLPSWQVFPPRFAVCASCGPSSEGLQALPQETVKRTGTGHSYRRFQLARLDGHHHPWCE